MFLICFGELKWSKTVEMEYKSKQVWNLYTDVTILVQS